MFPESAFVLHARPYRDTSLLLDLFSLNRGRVTAIARGVRKKGSKLSGLLLPFVPLMVFLAGKLEILNVTKAELNGAMCNLTGHSLLSGFYLNELLIRLLPKHDIHAALYNYYADTLQSLQQSIDNLQRQRLLRLFELKLLRELGYGLCLDKDISNNAIKENVIYNFKFGMGFVEAEKVSSAEGFAGGNLLALHNNKLENPEDFKATKRLLQSCLAHLLGAKPIKTRELF